MHSVFIVLSNAVASVLALQFL